MRDCYVRYLAACALLACTPSEQQRIALGPSAESPVSTPAPGSSPGAPHVQGSEPSTEASSNAAEVAVLEPDVLSSLEANGFALGKLVTGTDARTTAQLGQVPAFKSIFDVLKRDVEATARVYPLAKVTSIDGFRLFETKWLHSSEMSFELTGVFSRLDRRLFNERTCGEIRFVYRLGYEAEQGGAPIASRLPMTINVVFLVGGERDCQKLAQAWYPPRNSQGEAFVSWLSGEGPLGKAMQQRWSLKSVEVNLQSIRLQSTVHTTLGGHIEYVMRVFRPLDATRNAFVPAAMENMPDVPALSQNATKRAALLAYLRQPATLQALDLGVLRVPTEFLASHAISVAPRGLSRLGNRPFRQLFTDKDFADLDFRGYRSIRSSTALLRRLDGASCVGCHQSRSIAGFHHVGMDRADNPVFNSLHSGMSPHLRSELERRRAYVLAVARGNEPDEFRPIPERQGVGHGHGAPCGLGDSGLADWTCADGFRCVKLEDNEVGACLLDTAIGSPCEYGVMLSKSNPQRDRVTSMSAHACGERQKCDKNLSGFPLGTCGSSCSAKLPGSVCGDFLDVDGFQECFRARRSFAECAAKYVFGAGLRACDDENPCRQDYVCARTRTNQTGACVPPYFIYQLRLDGYPLKR